MNETPALPPPEVAAPAELPPPPASRRRSLLPWLTALGFVVLAVALGWVWQHPKPVPEAVAPQRIEAIAGQLRALSERVTTLAGRPMPAPVDLGPIERRVAALEQRPPPVTPDLGPVERQVAALQAQLAARPAGGGAGPELAPLESRVGALERRVQAAAAMRAGLDAVSRQLTGEQTEQRALATRVQDLDGALGTASASIVAQVEAARQQAGVAVAAAGKAARLERLAAARAALDAGRPVGTIDRAPPALARFAATPPPTEAALRLSFPAAAAAAGDASPPETAGQSFGQRLWQRAQQLVTVREGERVLVGNPAAGLLGQAGRELDAGDLAGAVRSVSALNGAAAQPMAAWLDQARSLLAARAALDAMAAPG